MDYKLFLDDERNPEDVFSYTNNQIYLTGWKIVRNYNDFIKEVEEFGIPEMISFDHDLGFEEEVEEKTGYHCAKWLVNYCMDNDLDLPNYMVHSMNIVGSRNINGLLQNYKKFRGQ